MAEAASPTTSARKRSRRSSSSSAPPTSWLPTVNAPSARLLPLLFKESIMHPQIASSSSITLRPYQLEALSAVERAVARGLRRMVVQLPTGTGKSVVAAELIQRTNANTLVLAPSDEILNQLVGTLKVMAPHLSVGVVKAELD